MIQEIKYGSYSANPSDYECADGDLALSLGMVAEDGAMKPVLPPKVVLTLEAGDMVCFIHTTSAFTHYIVRKANNAITSIDKETGTEQTVKEKVSNIPDSAFPRTYRKEHFNAVGNTLIYFSGNGTEYFLWKDGTYLNLGTHIPEVPISFGLTGVPVFYSNEKYNGGASSDDRYFDVTFSEGGSIRGGTIDDIEQKNVTEQVMAKVNDFVAEQTVNKGRFCFPFLLRYALRLYDGSLVMHSAPILMCPSTTSGVMVYSTYFTDRNISPSNTRLSELPYCIVALMAANIDYCVSQNSELSKWSDIVKSIDVYISKPIYTYDQSGLIKEFYDATADKSKFIGLLTLADTATVYSGTVSAGDPSTLYVSHMEWDFEKIFNLLGEMGYSFKLPEIGDDKLKESIRDTHNFYKLKSIDIEGINYGTREILNIDDDYLKSLTSREPMTDDYRTHEQVYAERSFAYNSRLNLSGVKRKLFKGFPAHAMFPYIDAELYQWSRASSGKLSILTASPSTQYRIEVYIKEEGETYKVESELSSGMCPFLSTTTCTETDNKAGTITTKKLKHSWGTYVFYPNPNAYKMVIYNNGTAVYQIDLKQHDFLHGAYGLLDFELERQNNVTTLPTALDGAENLVSTPNVVYTSEVNNPFYFPALGINAVGTGRIMGICAAVKALSQGQFGQFPLYAFSTDGVWSLEVSGTGVYSAKQPVTRDVCTNADAITQLDSSVLFVTDRGIMEIAGSETGCISEPLNSDDPVVLADLPKCYGTLYPLYNGSVVSHYSKVSAYINHPSELLMLPSDAPFSIVPFRDFLQGCRMLYDYPHQHIIVFNPNQIYAYVYSLKSKMWGMMHTDMKETVNSYPEALAVSNNYNLFDFSQTEDVDFAAGLVVTRPFTLGDPDLLKTIDTVIQRGDFVKDHVKQILYGTVDLRHWHPVWSSTDKYLRGFRGSPYKAFRLAFVCQFGKDESLYGCTVQFTPRLANRPR